jgi:hypothetical protein
VDFGIGIEIAIEIRSIRGTLDPDPDPDPDPDLERVRSCGTART